MLPVDMVTQQARGRHSKEQPDVLSDVRFPTQVGVPERPWMWLIGTLFLKKKHLKMIIEANLADTCLRLLTNTAYISTVVYLNRRMQIYS